MTNRKSAEAAMDRVIKTAIEIGLATSAEDFAAKSEKTQMNIIKSASKLLGRRNGQGWSR